ncbi:aldo/keto reductase [Streptomyces parvus]|uniref:aldo/keto reductase n=1 Tax=Streptomyces parvus TaxID=66428 RepID=UPI0038081A4B
MPSATFRIGGDLPVGRLGFGAMHLPTEKPEDRPSAVAVARRAVDLGITLIDTAHMYGAGANEEVLAEALHPYPKDLLITTKVGVVRSAEDREKVRERSAQFTWCPMPDGIFRRARTVQEQLTTKGEHRSAGPVDLLVAAVAEQSGLVLHHDRDFETIARTTGQPTRMLELR